MSRVLLTLAIYICSYLSAGVSVERTFSRDNAVIGECLQVTLAVSVSPSSPSVLILSEDIPPEIRVLSAYWQGQPIATRLSGGRCQWLLGWPEPLQSGVLLEQLSANR